jgi:hypothetical protein
MSSGLKSIFVSPLQRAYSTDINRLQALATRGPMEAWRWAVNVAQGTDEFAGGLASEVTSIGAPLVSEILGGLQVQPNQAALTLGIENGLTLAIDPDTTPSSDDSPYKYVQTTGQTPACTQTPSSAPLTMLGNTTGSPRIDIVECQRVQDPNPEVANRDIFNSTEQVFVATTSDITTDSVFQFRVRQGTSGGGFPGAASGWLPLAVALVPPGATTNDDIHFWDVRPLVADRVFGSNLQRLLPRRTKLEYTEPTSGDHVVQGVAEVELGSERMGGWLLGTCPDSSEADLGVDFTDAQNQEAGFAMPAAASQLVYYYFCRPFGLPRWAKLTAGYPRVPRPPRGLTVLSLTAPNVTGQPATPILLPTSYGFGSGASAQVTEAICWGATTAGFGAIGQCPTRDLAQYPTLPVADLTATSSGTFKTGTFSLVEGTNFPPGCRRVRCRFLLDLTLTSSAGLAVITPEMLIQLGTLQGANVRWDSKVVNSDGTPTTSVTLAWIGWLDLQSEWPNAVAAQTYTLSYTLITNPTTLPGSITIAAAPTLFVDGWKF